MSIIRIRRRSAITRDEAMRRHPAMQAIWTPADFTNAADDALALVREDTATIYDFATGEVIR